MLNKLPLEEEHKKLNARFFEFGGWWMPLEYKGVIEEHLEVRTNVGIFDISHMGRLKVSGEKVLDFLQFVTSNDVKKLYPGKAQYSLILSPNGTILDDILVFMVSSYEFLLIVNAGNREKILNWLYSNNSYKVNIEDITHKTVLFAIQGPKAEEITQKIFNIDLSTLKYYHFTFFKYYESDIIISRTGYTGEDGFELLIPISLAQELWKKFIYEENIKPCGLGARDTLRLEMGYPLYGHEIDENTTPWEANLSFVVKLDKDIDFIGKTSLLQLKDSPSKRQIAFYVDEGIPRQNYGIFYNDEKIGYVTSGSYSPILKKGIAIGYVKEIKEDMIVEIRNKRVKINLVKLPFVKNTSIKKGVK
ncbi:MAG: glycine cleavage system protein T [Dictyoglomus sp. NZ13-RE01]|nr:MAG: glycine cleavage system protein T [Dictyoglomus sp. NZ13-RE01]